MNTPQVPLPYHTEHRPDIDDCYDLLVGPDFECLLTDPEDRCWSRDGKGAVIELNRLHGELTQLKTSLEGLAAWMDASPSHVGSKLIRRVLAGEVPPAPGAEWEARK